LSQDAVGAGLISFAALLQPGDYIGVEAHGNGLLEGTIEPASNRIFPGAGRKLGDIRSVDLMIGQRG
jgi:hypothetical protein